MHRGLTRFAALTKTVTPTFVSQSLKSNQVLLAKQNQNGLIAKSLAPVSFGVRSFADGFERRPRNGNNYNNRFSRGGGNNNFRRDNRDNRGSRREEEPFTTLLVKGKYGEKEVKSLFENFEVKSVEVYPFGQDFASLVTFETPEVAVEAFETVIKSLRKADTQLVSRPIRDGDLADVREAATKTPIAVVVKNLPYSCTEEQFQEWINKEVGLESVAALNVCHGLGYVKLNSEADLQAFVEKGTGKFWTKFPTSASSVLENEYEKGLSRFTTTARLRNVPYSATESEILEMFNGLSIRKTHFFNRTLPDGTSVISDVFINFEDLKNYDDALARSGASLRDRSVKVIKSSPKEKDIVIKQDQKRRERERETGNAGEDSQF